MRWPAEFVSLLLCFANRVTEVGDLDISEALFHWTPLYLNFGLPQTFDAADPTWQRFLAGYRSAAYPVEWTHSFYLSRARDYPESPFGCFSYQCEPEQGSIRFHFGNHDASGHRPLSERQRSERLQELRTLFTDVRQQVPEAQSVRGRSWMYNLAPYCRLFPTKYNRSAAPVEAELQYMSLWGQFLDHAWNVRSDRVRTFLDQLAVASTCDELMQSFPMPVLAPVCSIDHFYAFYGIR